MKKPKKMDESHFATCASGDLACVNTAFRRAARRLGNLYDVAFEPTGLKATQVGLMARIAGASDHQGPTLQDLADQLAVSISALTHALRPLTRVGIVKVIPDAHDGRVKRGMLTTRGKALLKEALVLWGEVNRRVESAMGNEAAQQLRAIADFVSSDAFLQSYTSGLSNEERFGKKRKK